MAELHIWHDGHEQLMLVNLLSCIGEVVTNYACYWKVIRAALFCSEKTISPTLWIITNIYSWLAKPQKIYFETKKCPGGWFNIKIQSYQYRKSYCGDKTVIRLFYLHNVIAYTGKMTYSYWIKAWLLSAVMTCPFRGWHLEDWHFPLVQGIRHCLTANYRNKQALRSCTYK